jgi:hypothetical protein
MIGGCLTSLPTPRGRTAVATAKHPPILAFTLVMLVWGVASEALREIITGFLDQVRFD